MFISNPSRAAGAQTQHKGTGARGQTEGDPEDTHILAGGLEQAAGAEELAAHGVPVVQEQQQDEDGHDEDGGGHGCQETGEERTGGWTGPGASSCRPSQER